MGQTKAQQAAKMAHGEYSFTEGNSEDPTYDVIVKFRFRGDVGYGTMNGFASSLGENIEEIVQYSGQGAVIISGGIVIDRVEKS